MAESSNPCLFGPFSSMESTMFHPLPILPSGKSLPSKSSPSSPVSSSADPVSPSTALSSPPPPPSQPVSPTLSSLGQYQLENEPKAEAAKPFRRLPREILDRILDHILEDGLPNRYYQTIQGVAYDVDLAPLAPYAVISRAWQCAVEDHTFSRLYLTVPRLEVSGARPNLRRCRCLREIKFDILFEPRLVPAPVPPTKKRNLKFEMLKAATEAKYSKEPVVVPSLPRDLGEDPAWPDLDSTRMPPKRPQHEQDERDRIVFVQSMHRFLTWLHDYLGFDAILSTGGDHVRKLKINIELLNGLTREKIEAEFQAELMKQQYMLRRKFPSWLPFPSDDAVVRLDKYKDPSHQWRFRKIEPQDGLDPALLITCPTVKDPQFRIPPAVAPALADMITQFRIYQTDQFGGSVAHHRSHGYVFDLVAKMPHVTKLQVTFYDTDGRGDGKMGMLRRNEFARDLARVPAHIKDLTISFLRQRDAAGRATTVAETARGEAEQNDMFSVAVRGLLRRLRHLTLENAMIGPELFWPCENASDVPVVKSDNFDDGKDHEGMQDEEDEDREGVKHRDKGKGIALPYNSDGRGGEDSDNESALLVQNRERESPEKRLDKGKGVERDGRFCAEEEPEEDDVLVTGHTTTEDDQEREEMEAGWAKFDVRTGEFMRLDKRKRLPLDEGDDESDEIKRRNKGTVTARNNGHSEDEPEDEMLEEFDGFYDNFPTGLLMSESQARPAAAVSEKADAPSGWEDDEDEAEDLPEDLQRWAPTPLDDDPHFSELETVDILFPAITPNGSFMMPPSEPPEPNRSLFNRMFQSAAYLAQRSPRLRKISLESSSVHPDMSCPRLEYKVDRETRHRVQPGKHPAVQSYRVRKASLEVRDFNLEMDPTVLAWKTANVVHTTIYADEETGQTNSTSVPPHVRPATASATENTRQKIRGPMRMRSNFFAAWGTGARWMGDSDGMPDGLRRPTASPPRGPLSNASGVASFCSDLLGSNAVGIRVETRRGMIPGSDLGPAPDPRRRPGALVACVPD